MLSDQNGLAATLQLIQKFGSFTLQGRNEFSAHEVILKYHSCRGKAAADPLRIHGLCLEPHLEALAGRKRCLRESLKAHSELVWQQRLPYALHLAAKILLGAPQVVVDLHAVPELG